MYEVEVDRRAALIRLALELSIDSDMFAGGEVGDRFGRRGHVMSEHREELAGAFMTMMVATPRQLITLPNHYIFSQKLENASEVASGVSLVSATSDVNGRKGRIHICGV